MRKEGSSVTHLLPSFRTTSVHVAFGILIPVIGPCGPSLTVLGVVEDAL